MQRLCLLMLLLAISGCADHPDPTTQAIAAAHQRGGICDCDSVTSIAAGGVTQYDSADRALRDISALIYNAPE